MVSSTTQHCMKFFLSRLLATCTLGKIRWKTDFKLLQFYKQLTDGHGATTTNDKVTAEPTCSESALPCEELQG